MADLFPVEYTYKLVRQPYGHGNLTRWETWHGVYKSGELILKFLKKETALDYVRNQNRFAEVIRAKNL